MCILFQEVIFQMPRTKKTETAAVETTAAVSVKKTTAKKACKKAVTPDNFVIQSLSLIHI